MVQNSAFHVHKFTLRPKEFCELVVQLQVFERQVEANLFSRMQSPKTVRFDTNSIAYDTAETGFINKVDLFCTLKFTSWSDSEVRFSESGKTVTFTSSGLTEAHFTLSSCRAEP